MTVDVHTLAGVPGLLWSPPSPAGLVLLGHGGGSHKGGERVVGHARWFAAAGFASLAVDGPFHGSRVPAPLTAADYRARIAAAGVDAVVDGMVADWLTALATVEPLVDTGRVAYLGMSMGTRYGLPLAAVLGDRLRCVVLGKFAPDSARLWAEARRLGVPALFHVQWDDELFPRDDQLALFDALGPADKELCGFTGGHGDNHPEALRRWREYVARHLR